MIRVGPHNWDLKMKSFKSLFAITTLFIASNAFAAGSCTYSRSPSGYAHPYPKYELTYVCTGDASGDVVVDCTDITLASGITGINPCEGQYGTVIRYRIIPGTDAAAPDTLYDIELRNDTHTTIDYLYGGGDDLSETDATDDFPITTNGGSVELFGDVLVPFGNNMGDGATEQFTLKVLIRNSK